ncbi:9384_t:CDS:2 [Ambispora gerdemannii]|uniref:9384_t:CDS:1 n=1 Tax=Ambispora gerdemannii TaxID=144530 RepID=A0A9N9BE72_9GLOM|nr:9384_t:CDS:2 [Ambispora gerdemannii]
MISALNNSNLNTGSEITDTTNSGKEQELNKISCQILQQCVNLLLSLPSNETYTWKSKFIPTSTIGRHVRSIAKENIINGSASTDIDNSDVKWTVNYDDRKSQVTETSFTFAVQQIIELQNILLNSFQNKSLLLAPIQLEAIIDSNPKVKPMNFSTTFGRELWFCCLHAIHHYALIRVICCEQNIPCPDEFGVAPSTLKRFRSREVGDDYTNDIS